MGLAGGGGGFDGSRKDVHESTAALLRQLMAATTSPSQPERTLLVSAATACGM